jgi:hypothetical protein
LTAKEMPGDEIIIIPIKGLVASSNQNGSTKEGFILFIRGNYKPHENEETPASKEEEVVEEESENNDILHSKESRVAQIYHDLVYYPFIHKIRMTNYEMDDKDEAEVPDNVTTVCWMDGCYSQLKFTTREDVLDKEHKKNNL